MLARSTRQLFRLQSTSFYNVAKVAAARHHVDLLNSCVVCSETWRSDCATTEKKESVLAPDFLSLEDQSSTKQRFQIPQRIRQKVISAADAVSLVRDGDTVCATGFVCQGKLS